MPSPREQQLLENQILKEASPLRAEPPIIEEEVEDEVVADVRKTVKMLQSEELADADDAFDDKEVVMNRRIKQAAAKQPLDAGKTTEAKKMEIEKMSKKLEEEA